MFDEQQLVLLKIWLLKPISSGRDLSGYGYFDGDFDQYLRDSEHPQATLVYEEACVCDTPDCNTEGYGTMKFFCHGGDYDLKEIQKDPILLNQTFDCYTNRKHCFIMKYHGKITFKFTFK